MLTNNNDNPQKHYRLILIYIGSSLILIRIGITVIWLIEGYPELEPISVIFLAIGGLILTIVSMFTNSTELETSTRSVAWYPLKGLF